MTDVGELGRSIFLDWMDKPEYFDPKGSHLAWIRDGPAALSKLSSDDIDNLLSFYKHAIATLKCILRAITAAVQSATTESGKKIQQNKLDNRKLRLYVIEK